MPGVNAASLAAPCTAFCNRWIRYIADTLTGNSYLLQGLAVELQVSDRDEITETEIHDHVISVLTRK